MQLNLTNTKTINILQAVANRLELPIETVIDLVLAFTDTDKVLALGKQLKAESTNDNHS